MDPLLFMPFNSDCQEYLLDLPVSYDLKCSETFGQGAMNITISEKMKIGKEPVYKVSLTTVKVMPDLTVRVSEVGEITAGLATKVWTTRRVLTVAGREREREIITRHVRNTGTHYTIEHIFGDTQPPTEERSAEKQDKRDKKKIKPKTEEKEITNKSNENLIRISVENLENFLSLPAAAILEKLFAQRKCSLNIKDLKTLNDSGEIISVSYDSKVKESCLEIYKIQNNETCSENWRKTLMDFSGNILTCKFDETRWVRDKEVQPAILCLPSLHRFSAYQEGRLERLVRQENYRRNNPDLAEVFRDLLQHLLMTKPQSPISAMKEYCREISILRS